MTKNYLKFNIIFSGIILLAVFAAAGPVRAQSTDILDIEFESGLNPETNMFNPLFEEAGMLPGESVTRWVKATNKTSSDIIPVAAKAVVNSPDNRLAAALILTITEQGALAPSYAASLADFFALDGVFLSNLAPGSSAIYDFAVDFEESAGNEYNNKDNENNVGSLDFDIVVGDGTDESFGGESSGGSNGGGGGYSYFDLRLYNESAEAGYDWAAVSWSTNIAATSRVVYDTVSHRDLGGTSGPNYGYAFSTIEDPNKTLSHALNIPGLIPLTTYYFRPLSKASPEKYGQELSFTTTAGPDEIIVLGSEYAAEPPEPEEKEQPSVLGWEGVFAASGFSAKEFTILLLLLAILIGSTIGLKRKYLKNKK